MLKKITSYSVVLLGMIVVMSSCKKEYESIESTDQVKIADYLTKNNINATADPEGTGYYYQVLSQGTGSTTFSRTDSVLYAVSMKSLLNGTVYYTTPTNTNIGTRVGYTNSLLGLNAPGIRKAILELKPGGTARVILPSHLAFGKNGNTSLNIPSNEIIDVVITTYPETTQRSLDDRLIREFIAAKGLTATKVGSGVYYTVLAQGAGTAAIDMNSTIKAKYTGRYMDGTQFDSSTDGTFSFTLTSLQANWDVLTKFTQGAKVRLFIPSSEAYGTAGSTGVLPNAILDFDIEIVEVTN